MDAITSHVLLPIYHIIKDILIVGTSCFFIGRFVNNLFPEVDLEKDKRLIFLETAVQCTLIVILIYYFQILHEMIPFLQSGLNSRLYMIIGETFAYSLILFSTQTKLKDKMRILSEEDICHPRDAFKKYCEKS